MPGLVLFFLACASNVCDEPSKHWDNACVAVTALKDPDEDPGTDDVTFYLAQGDWSQIRVGTWDEPAGLWFPGLDGVGVRVVSEASGVSCVGVTEIDLEPFEYREVDVQTRCQVEGYE